jgi:hypothetical protein
MQCSAAQPRLLAALSPEAYLFPRLMDTLPAGLGPAPSWQSSQYMGAALDDGTPSLSLTQPQAAPGVSRQTSVHLLQASYP